jgi:hypothetical protein
VKKYKKCHNVVVFRERDDAEAVVKQWNQLLLVLATTFSCIRHEGHCEAKVDKNKELEGYVAVIRWKNSFGEEQWDCDFAYFLARFSECFRLEMSREGELSGLREELSGVHHSRQEESARLQESNLLVAQTACMQAELVSKLLEEKRELGKKCRELQAEVDLLRPSS